MQTSEKLMIAPMFAAWFSLSQVVSFSESACLRHMTFILNKRYDSNGLMQHGK